MIRVFVDGDDWGHVLSDEEIDALTADQLREAIFADGYHVIIRHPHGGYDLIAYDYGDQFEEGDAKAEADARANNDETSV